MGSRRGGMGSRPSGKIETRAVSPDSPLDNLERIEQALGRYRHLATAREFVNGNPRATVTLTTTAHAIGISKCHLARLFHENIGVSFHYWLTLRRIHVATNLIRETPITASQAAQLSGFASYRSFARAFKEIVGLSPSDYLRRAQQFQRARIRK